MTGDAPGLLIRDVELYGQGAGDCRVSAGIIAETGRSLPPRPDEVVVRGDGGTLLPGLADHHLHLLAMAAREESLDASTLSRDDLAGAIAGVTGEETVRVVGYDDVVHGDLDRAVLDAWNPAVPVRVQHRSGALWVVNSQALDRLGADTATHEGIERDNDGRPTGRLWRADAWLRAALGTRPPSLRLVGARLAAFGITHVADATPDPDTAAVIAAAVQRNELPQHVMVMAADIAPGRHPRVSVGPVKLVVADHALPDVGDLTDQIKRAHDGGRPVAVHCVTRTALALTLAALDQAGHLDGDRIEHCAVADRTVAEELSARGVRVVTQPTLVARRGDDYWERVEPEDQADLWPYATLLDAGIPVAASSDAPYGDPDPWACLRAATERRTPSGRILGPDERVATETVLRGMLSALDDAGGSVRQIVSGHSADLVLLDRPLADALRAPDAGHVRATIIGGQITYGAANLG